MDGLQVPFLDALMKLIGFKAFVVLEDIVVLMGGIFIGGITVLLIVSKWYKLEILPPKYGDQFGAIRFKEDDDEKESFYVQKPSAYRESVARTISLIAMFLFNRKHTRKRTEKVKQYIYIIIAFYALMFILSIFFILHVAKP